MSQKITETSQVKFEVVLIALLVLFVIRVLAQLIQVISPVAVLPPFEVWQSGAIPYSGLFVTQVVIIAFCIRAIWKVHSQVNVNNGRTGRLYLIAGGLYFIVMILRLIAGNSFASEHYWFSAQLPTYFHLVLASFLLTLGFYYFSERDRLVAFVSYPTIISLALIFHYLCILYNVNLFASTYVPVLLAAMVITFLEFHFPQRESWLPNRFDVINDSIYLLIVQAVIPRMLGFLVAITLLRNINIEGSVLTGLWPHHWPVIMQAALMLVSAELLRYWLHRLAHNWTILWRLHAVHHSPHKLYWLNVGRFHPLEKAIQYLFDALPFILLGVSEQVLAIYFVFYAINGFFQHCNIRLRLGFLNYVISGPELHRWHHSKLVDESNNNYGNNLIIWDLIFGSWYLPTDRYVEDLGLVNRKYPLDFGGQLVTPFLNGQDKASP